MTKPDRIAAALVKAALELHARQLWAEVASEALFLLRLPGQPAPLVGCIMGQSGEQFGINVVRGEQALSAMLRLMETEGDDVSVLSDVTSYGVTVQPLHEIEPVLRALVQAAGLQLRRDALAPLALCKPVGGRARPANRSEWKLLTTAIRAVLAAHASGEFTPEPVDERSRRIMELVVEESDASTSEVRVRAHVVQWPAGTTTAPSADTTPAATDDDVPTLTPWDTGGLPQTLDEWKLADVVITGRLVKAVTDAQLLNKRMLARYFGSFPRAKQALEQCSGLQPIGGFMEWVFADWFPGVGGTTLLEQRLADPATSPVERALWRGRADARLSIYRVDAVRPGDGLDVEDVLSGERTTVSERGLSGSVSPGMFLVLRLMRVGSWDFCSLAGPPLAARDMGAALDLLERQGADLSAGCLRRLPQLTGRLWELAVDRDARQPRIGNSDGEPMEFQAATFRVLNPEMCARDLDKRSDLDRDERDMAWDWVRPDTSDRKGERLSVLGRLELIDDRLVLEVNSAKRLARARKWIEKLPGVRFDTATIRALDAQRPLDDRLESKASREPPTPEQRRQYERVVHDLYVEWLDKPVPVLGNVSPRAACRTEAGRQQVALLVRTMTDTATPAGPMPPPRAMLLRELGIGTQGREQQA